MKAIVIYDSLYGNTETIAQTIASAIATAGGASVDAVPLRDADPASLAAYDLLVIGSPTHGAMPTEAMQGLLARIPPPAREGARAAIFDTRLTWPFLERWGGFAAPKMAETLATKGWAITGEPGGFFVKGLKKGPLKKGEVDRAAAWAGALLQGIE